MNAAVANPTVQGLCRALNAMGARIEGIGTNVLEAEGVPVLHGARHRLAPDHIEIGSFVAIAAMTGGELRVRDIVPDHLSHDPTGLRPSRCGNGDRRHDLHRSRVPETRDRARRLRGDPEDRRRALAGLSRRLDAALALVLATQCEGTVLIHEKLFESRLFFVDSVIAMGARVVLCDPHRALVIGPSRLHAATIVSPDIRAGMALIAAALCAEGRSIINNAWQVDRGYEQIHERLRALGARIVRQGR